MNLPTTALPTPRPTPEVLVVLAMLAFGALPGTGKPALAQDPSAHPGVPGDWYRVELLIFSQGQGSAAAAEQWDPQPLLAYPQQARFLVYPERVEQRAAGYPGGESSLDERGVQTIILPQPEPGTGAEGEAPPPDSAPDIPLRTQQAAVPEAAADGLAETASEPTDNGQAPPPPPLPRPFATRPATEREFNGKTAYMERRGGYRILFHESWLQPLASKSAALPLVLDDSGASQNYPPLQGTVTLSLSRYLQIDTRLWLNTDGSYLKGDWPMPAPPLGPTSLVLVAPEPVPGLEAGEMSGAGDTLAGEMIAGEATPPPGTVINAAAMPGAGGFATAGETAARAAYTDFESLYGAGRSVLQEVDVALQRVDTGPLYPYRHAVLLRQSRRMRDGEAHYIDHPLLGVVVKVTPVTAQELLALAQHDAAAGEDHAAATAGPATPQPGPGQR
ncbi:MAG: CsiV family protein [Parahaliea sp.]